MSRWKGRGAKAVAEAAPLSGLYDEIRRWPARLECALSASGGTLVANCQQARLLCATGFGSDVLSTPDRRGDGEDLATTHVFQLMLEEVFYLSYELDCLRVHRQSSQGRVDLTLEQLWCLMQEFNREFVKMYKAYSHLRNKRWVVRPGPQYGADFMAYRHHPTLVHSDYAVLVIPADDPQSRLASWTDVQGMTRLCGSVAKTLLVLYIIVDMGHDLSSPTYLERITVEEVEVRRWLPQKHREDSQ
ncbi:tRNA-splicing endonuclease subunit Sen2-1-like isoform X1 [Selaginella moellendorffii]|uniref:tRNA-splicing endonuclease subunit Sen2-1-like isoform X1 n=1 Tax=Selaginella moellendorffii TaxID=88036 RepID=UPI000D1C49AF|nr:tRNA-splicing endonuclease subunit Sen2-1-like isoform X1 [Selaginella moellendorffii]|eukprot:XP_024534705.1 tRNA-splicing endonuclease subunit Sen2-1-like isoform X1 [Selaginella moellendorffii]